MQLCVDRAEFMLGTSTESALELQARENASTSDACAVVCSVERIEIRLAAADIID